MAIIDDYGNNTRTAGKFITNKTTGETAATGKIEVSGDKDWFFFRAKPNTYYKINLDETNSGDLALYTNNTTVADDNTLRIYDDTDLLEKTDSLGFYSGPKAQSYYVEVSSANTGRPTYTLKLEEVVDDHLGSRTTKTALVPDTPLTGSIQWADFNANADDFSDKDWFRLSAAADTFYTIKLTEKEVDNFEKGILKIYDSKSDLALDAKLTEDDDGVWARDEYAITNEDDTDGYYELTFLNGDATTYYIEVSDQNSGQANAETFDYELSATAIIDDYASITPTGIIKAKGVLTDTVTGIINWAGDKDWFKLSAVPNTLYEIKLDDSTVSLDEVTNLGMLKILDSKGDFLLGDDPLDIGGETPNESLLKAGLNYCIVDNQDGTNSLLFIAPDKPTDYYIEVDADEGEEPSAIGSYTLSVVAGLDDYSASTQTTGVLTDGMTGRVNSAGDKDWIKLSAAANMFYTITLDDETDENPLYNGTLQLYDNAGNLLTQENEDGIINLMTEDFIVKNNEDGMVSLTLLKPGAATYYIEVSGDDDADVGNYTLNVTATPEYSGDTSTRSILKESSPISSAIDLAVDTDGDNTNDGDIDYFKLSVSKGNYYRITLDDETLAEGQDNALSTGVLKIETKAGGTIDPPILVEKGSAAASEKHIIEFLATESATYYVSVAEDGYDGTGNYQLSVEKFTDDYSGDKKTKGILKTNKPTEGNIDWVDSGSQSDVDYLKLSAAGNSLYRIVISENDANITQDLDDLILKDFSENILGTGEKGAKSFTISANGAFEIKQDEDDPETWIIALYNATKKTSSFFLELSADPLGANFAQGLLDLGYTVTTERYAAGILMDTSDTPIGPTTPIEVIDALPTSFWDIG